MTAKAVMSDKPAMSVEMMPLMVRAVSYTHLESIFMKHVLFGFRGIFFAAILTSLVGADRLSRFFADRNRRSHIIVFFAFTISSHIIEQPQLAGQ